MLGRTVAFGRVLPWDRKKEEKKVGAKWESIEPAGHLKLHSFNLQSYIERIWIKYSQKLVGTAVNSRNVLTEYGPGHYLTIISRSYLP